MIPTTRHRWRSWLFAAFACLGTVSGCNEPAPPSPAPEQSSRTADEANAATASLEREIRAFCGACHAVPRPDSFPRSAWYEEVRRGYEFYYESGRSDLTLPPLADVVAWYQERAPDQLEIKPEPSTPSPVRFREEPIRSSRHLTGPDPAVSFLEWVENGSAGGEFRLSDMRHGVVQQFPLDFSQDPRRWTVVPNPVAVRECDLDGNGVPDLLFCDLGSFQPEDHDRGQVVWLRDGTRDPEATPQVLLSGIGRVADVQVADFDGDGKDDLVVAEFGWQRTGGIHVLWNLGPESPDDPTPRFRVEQIDDRSGTIHVPTVDLDGDGRIDIVALISQEHEMVVAYMNRPDGFEPVTLYAAPDPSWGSSGIELVDLDGDGRIDVLYTNGDTFDSHLVKPYHGIIWLENRADLSFRAHPLAKMPGVHRALAADLTGNGLLDIAACALIPHRAVSSGNLANLDSVIWLQQVEPGQFERHSLKRGEAVHATLVTGDFNANGNIDLAVGCFYSTLQQTDLPVAVLFWNEGLTERAD